jgi:hypothetical protein
MSPTSQGRALGAATCLQAWGGLPASRVFLGPVVCYFNSIILQGMLLCHHVSPDLGRASAQPCIPNSVGLLLHLRHPKGRARSSSHTLTRHAVVRQGRQSTFILAVGSRTATTVGMMCPLRRDSIVSALCLPQLALHSMESRWHS